MSAGTDYMQARGAQDGSDLRLLFAGRAVRMFAYGFLAVILALYLRELGFSDGRIGLLFTMTLLGDVPVSLLLTTHADKLGRRKTLVVGAALMLVAGLVFVSSGNFYVLLAAATLGVISPSGYEVGPFLPVEQAALSHVIHDSKRTGVFAWYNLLGTFATAVGSLAGGAAAHLMQVRGQTALESYRVILIGYAAMGLAMAMIFLLLSSQVEVDRRKIEGVVGSFLGLHKSRRRVMGLSGLFAMDALGGGFVVQGMIVLWFKSRFGDAVNDLGLGTIFFAANTLAAVSALSASWLASRIGLIRTMVFTHLPSNVLLMLVPFMPNLWWAIGLLLVRFSISQMDVPTRQSYTMAMVEPDERSAAAGVTGVARSLGAMAGPSLAGKLLASGSLMFMPFVLGGGLKIVYDLLLYRNFKATRPPEEIKA